LISSIFIQYVGFWYEAYRSDVIFEFGSRCVNATYTPNPDGSVGVWNQEISLAGDYTSIRGSAKVKNASEPAAFIVTFNTCEILLFFTMIISLIICFIS